MSLSVMVDLETLGTKANAPIMQIGAVVFDDETGIVYRDRVFECKVLLNSEIENIDPETLKWWLTKDPALMRHVLAGEPRITLLSALDAFGAWLADQNAKTIWADSPSFDVAILRNSFARFNLRFPMSFRQERCFRTIKNLATEVGLKSAPNLNPHDALCDAIYQAECAVVILKRLKQPAVA